jgi:4-hydroxybenzoate polyprenyltransferase
VLVGVAVFPGLTLAAVPYFWGVTIASALLFYEHTLVKANDLSKLDAAFFTMNGVISLTFFGFVLAERLVR